MSDQIQIRGVLGDHPISLGLSIVGVKGLKGMHLVPTADAVQDVALTLRVVDDPHYPRRIWQGATTICGRKGPWNRDVRNIVGGCPHCYAGIKTAYDDMPPPIKVALGWGEIVDGVWQGPPFYDRD